MFGFCHAARRRMFPVGPAAAIAAAIAAAVAIAGSAPAAPRPAASTACQPHTAIAARLSGRYGETLRARGVITPMLIELFANPRTGTFTILLVRPDRLACIVAAGDGWREQPATGPKPRDAASHRISDGLTLAENQ